MLRTAAALVFLTMVSVPGFAGQTLDSARDTDAPIAIADTPGTARLNVSVIREVPPRPGALPVLYVSYAALQAFDGYQTIQGVAGGGRELNPLMTGIASSPAAVWTIKAVSTVVAIGAAERLWKTNKAGAIAVMLIANGVSVAVAAHNASVLRQLR
jgi:Domain of unknown function (DUF5658)